jgi:hypothetical protein
MRVVAPAMIALCLAPRPTRACGCGTDERPTPERCAPARRVFAGVVEDAFDIPPDALDRRVVLLGVDRVW